MDKLNLDNLAIKYRESIVSFCKRTPRSIAEDGFIAGYKQCEELKNAEVRELRETIAMHQGIIDSYKTDFAKANSSKRIEHILRVAEYWKDLYQQARKI